MSFYAWPSADDFTFPRPAHLALVHGESVLDAIIWVVGDYYKIWQGSFTAMTMMAIGPNFISEQLYFLTTFVMLGSFLAGTFKLTDTLVRRGLGFSWREVVYVAVPIAAVSIQLVPSPLDSFFWYNGAVYYTFTYGICLLYVERLFALFLSDKTSPAVVLPGCLWGFFVGGSNYVSALLSLLLCGCFLLYALWRKRKKVLGTVIMLAPLVVTFLISFFCPGNAIRQDTVTGMGAVEAIYTSILRAGKDCLDNVTLLPALLVLLAMVPLLWRLGEKTDFTFPLPLLFSVFSFLLYAAQNAPHYYAVSTSGPPRLRNIVFFAFWWLAAANLWYWLGWLRRVWRQKKPLPREAAGVWVVACLALLCLSLPFQSPRPTTIECVAELLDGTPQAYHQEQEARLEIILNTPGNVVVVPPIQNKPKMIFESDITPDHYYWTNQAMAWYYEKWDIYTSE